MPRLRSVGRVAGYTYQANDFRKEDRHTAQAGDNARAEWHARCGIPQDLVEFVVEFYRQSGNAVTADVFSTDPGAWNEMWWRVLLREMGPPGYKQAEEYRSFRDSVPAPSLKQQFDLKELAHLRALAGESIEVLQRKHDEQVWGGITQLQRAKALSNYLNVALQCRPHGFSSIGRVPQDTPMGRLLLHGLHIFLSTCFDPAAALQLQQRHARSVMINSPVAELQYYAMNYSDGQKAATFTGALPPAAAQVPLFDHLALHWQLQLVNNVIAGLMPPGCSCQAGDECCSHYQQPLDHVYNWAAFNKLLLLGMYAPVEEAEAGPQQPQLVLQQLTEVAHAREAEAASACSNMQETLSQLRVVLHEQLQAEIALGQAALQLFAWQQQQHHRQQGSSNPDLLAKLQQRLQSCLLSQLWSSNNSSTSESEGQGGQQSEQLLLLMCSLLAWPLVALPELLQHLAMQEDTTPDAQQAQQTESEQQQQQQDTQLGLSPMRHLLKAAVHGLDHSKQHKSTAVGGLRGFMQYLQGLRPAAGAQTAPEQQQQQLPQPKQQDQEQQEAVLFRCLLSLVMGEQYAPAASSAAAAPEVQQGEGAALQKPAAQADDASLFQSPSADGLLPSMLQAFTRGMCHVLLVKLFASAPPCETWSWDVCVCILQLLVAVEAANSEAAAFTCSSLTYLQVRAAAASVAAGLDESEQQAALGGLLPPGQEHTLPTPGFGSWTRKLVAVLQLLPKAASALQACGNQNQQQQQHAHGPVQHSRHCSSSSSSSNGSSSSSSSTGCRSGGSIESPIQAASRQQLLDEHARTPTFWRSQTLQLYKDTRQGGSAWLSRYFTNVNPDNPMPGFWGLVGRFAAADQLNLIHMVEPTAVAAAPLAVLKTLEAGEERSNYIEQSVVSKQLARLANRQLMTQFAPSQWVTAAGSGISVQRSALTSLMQCAVMAAQQPQLLAYARAPQQAVQAAANAAAAAAARQLVPDADGDVFLSPCASPEPGVGGGGGAAAAGGSVRVAADAAAMAAAAAAAEWLGVAGFHLSSAAAALAPLFERDQQGPCLVRFLQLLLQYYADSAAAAGAAMQGLQPELRQRRLWVPRSGSSANSRAGSMNGAQGRAGSSNGSTASYVPPDRSRLLVLLMGLYHLQMLELQQQQQQKQQWEEQQQQNMQTWGSHHGATMGRAHTGTHGICTHSQEEEQEQWQEVQEEEPQQQQRQQLRRQHRHPPPAPLSKMEAAAAAVDAAQANLYADVQLRYKQAAAAVEAAFGMQDVLTYCLMAVEHVPAAQGSGAAYSSSSSSSSSSSDSRRGPSKPRPVCPQQRYEVCPITMALVEDGVRLQAQQPGVDYPASSLCDYCSSLAAVERATQRSLIQGLPPSGVPAAPRATSMPCSCGACWCERCHASPLVQTIHQRFCSPLARSMQQAHLAAVLEAGFLGTIGDIQLTTDNVDHEEPCRCETCIAAAQCRGLAAFHHWSCHPLVQRVAPWSDRSGCDQQQQQQAQLGSLLPVAGTTPIPKYILAIDRAAHYIPQAEGDLLEARVRALDQFEQNLAWSCHQLLMAQKISIYEEGQRALQQAAAAERDNRKASNSSNNGSSSTNTSASSKGRGSGQQQQQQRQSQRQAGASSSGSERPWRSPVHEAAAAAAASVSSSAGGLAGSSSGLKPRGPAGLGSTLGVRKDRKQKQQQQPQQQVPQTQPGSFLDDWSYTPDATWPASDDEWGGSEADGGYAAAFHSVCAPPERSASDTARALSQLGLLGRMDIDGLD